MNTYKFIAKVLPLLAVLVLLQSCKKFLEEAPSKTSSLVVKTTEQLTEMLNNPSTFYSESNRSNSLSSDDYGLTLNIYNGGRSAFTVLTGMQFMLWDNQYIAKDARENFWSGEFGKIFRANMVLNELDKVSGPETEKAILKADAHFIRAYSYWVLANTYCLPYTEANKNEPGLPIKLTTSFDESMVRQSLEKTYQQIESDLAEALKTPVTLNQTGQARIWRASKAGVNGFAARYYLNRNDNTKAIAYANAALAEYSTLVDYNTQMRYGRDEVVTVTITTPPPPITKQETVRYPYGHDNQVDNNPSDALGWKEFLYYRVLNNDLWWYIPSEDLLGLYDKNNDLRYEYHMVEHYSYTRGMSNPAFDYPGYVFFFKDKVPSGPTVAEMLLIKAEAQARLNDPSGAMATVNILRQKRIKTNTLGINLTASSKDDAIKKVLEERRREMPYAQRWFDIRRYNNNDDPNDDVLMTRTFYPFNGSSILFNEAPKSYVLPKNSRRFAAPIPDRDIVASNGAIVQNTY